MGPKFLCIIPFYNAESTLKGAIESIINQSYTNWELIMVDDASTDKSLKIAKSYVQKYKNITLLQNKTNQGCYYSRNRALYHSRGKKWDVFTTHDADDTSTKDRFEIYYRIMFELYPNSIMGMGIFNGKRNVVMDDNPYIKYFKGANATGVSFYKREIFDVLGYFWDTRYGGDMEYTLRIGEYAFRACPEGVPFEKHKEFLIRRPSYDYAYCYTTGFHPKGSLTQIHNKKERLEFRSHFQDCHQKWKKREDFYINFQPTPEDIS